RGQAAQPRQERHRRVSRGCTGSGRPPTCPGARQVSDLPHGSGNDPERRGNPCRSACRFPHVRMGGKRHVFVFEDPAVGSLEPLTLTRPAFDLWCGSSRLLERQCRHFAADEAAVLVRPALAGLCRLTYPGLAVNEPARLTRGGAVLVNARWLPPAGLVPDGSTPRVALVGNQVAYAVLPPGGL